MTNDYNPVLSFISACWEKVTRLFMTCNIDRCYSDDILYCDFEDDPKHLYINVSTLEGIEKLYVYYCPCCGRRLREK